MEPPSTSSVAIVNQTGRRLRLEPIRRAARSALRRGTQTSTRGGQRSISSRDQWALGQVTILLDDDKKLRELNRSFRGIDASTDVLSFPADASAGYLGDIAISVTRAEQQARLRRVSLSNELGFLAIHGVLHLLGYDDDTERSRAEMVAEMNKAAVEAGLQPDPDWHSALEAQAELVK